MDIFLINIDSAEKVPKVLLDEYQKKEMSDGSLLICMVNNHKIIIHIGSGYPTYE